MAKGKLDAGLTEAWRQYEKYLNAGNKDQSDRMHFPSGIPGLDIGVGGMKGMNRGIVELIGGEAVGKTTLALTILAETQRTRDLVEIDAPDNNTYNAVYMDFEHSYDNEYAAALGVDTAKMLVIDMTYAQDQFGIVEYLLTAGIQFVIIDSISVIIPKSEEDKGLNDNQKMADEANTLSRALKRLNALAASADALIICINQYRANMSPMAHTDKKGYGAWVLRYLKKVTIELTRIERKDTRMTIQAFVSKNKMGATGTKINYEIEHGKGIDVDQHILMLAEHHDIVTYTGKKTWWYYTDDNGKEWKGQGEQNAIKNFPMEEIKQKVMVKLHESITTDE